MADIEDRLVVRMEATLRNFEKQMERARTAANTNATGIENRFTQMGARMGQSSERAARGLSNVVNISSRGRFVIQNTANQIGDIAVQLQGGAGAARAFGQQLPQLFGGLGALGGSLGVIGPLLGTIAAIGIPIAASMIAMGRGTDDASDSLDGFVKAVKVMEEAVAIAQRPLADLREEFGEFAEEVRNAALVAAQAAATQAMTAFEGISSAIRSNIAETLDLLVDVGMLEEAYARLQEQQRQGLATSEQVLVASEALEVVRQKADEAAASVGLTTDQAILLEAALSALDEVESWDDIVKGASDALSVIQSIFPPTAKIPPEVANIVAELNRVIQTAATAAAAVDDIGAAAAAAADEAANLANALPNAGPTDEDLQRAEDMRAYGQGQSAMRDRIGTGYTLPRTPESKPSGSSRRRSSGGRSRRTEESIADLAQREIDSLQRQIELLGKTEREAAKLTAQYRLLDEAKRQGLDLDARQVATGETLREEIERQSEAIGRLTEQNEMARDRAEAFGAAQQNLKDGFIDAIVEGKNLGGVLENLAKQLARAALQAALFNEGPFATSGGGGGLLGGIFSAISGGLTGGGSSLAPSTSLRPPSFAGGGYTGSGSRSGGVDGMGGFPAILHPRETVIDHTKGGQGGGRQEVVVTVDLKNDMLDARIVRGAGRVVVGYDRQLPARVNAIAADKRKR